MSKAVAGLDRTIFFILGLVLIALGLWPVLAYFNVEFAQHLALWIDHEQWSRVPDQQWWPWALGIGAAVATVLAIVLLVLNLRARRINKVETDASDENGTITMHMNSIASAIAESLEHKREIVKADRKVAYDRKDPQLTFTLTAEPETSLTQLGRIVDSTERDFREAFPTSKLHTVYQVQYERLSD